jgi:hypothetical protein
MAAPADALRLVLFGAPAAGKSALLGALGRAAATGSFALDGRVFDPNHALDELGRKSDPSPTDKEIVPYPVTYRESSEGAGLSQQAVVFDSSGRAADALLRTPNALDEPGALAEELQRADAVVLALDAAEPPQRRDERFKEFEEFLTSLERTRGRRVEVGDLPVFLVLTKCDRLARPGDSTADWIDRVEERKREVGERFQEFLTRDDPNRPPPFGGVELHLWATAVRRPALTGAPHAPGEAFGVAELFRQCFDEAEDYRDDRRNSARRLRWLTAVSGGAAGALLAAAATLVGVKATFTPPSELQLLVAALRAADPPTPAERLRGSLPRLAARAEDLESISKRSAFVALPSDLRAWVAERLQETRDYIAWRKALDDAPRPRDALTEAALLELRGQLDGPLKPPQPEWTATDAGKSWTERTAEADALLKAIMAAREWYRRAYARADAAWAFAGAAAPIDWNVWGADAERLLKDDAAPPFADDDIVVNGPPSVTYASVTGFTSVAEARSEWEGAMRRLRRIRDIGAALGLIEAAKGLPDVLALPASGFRLDDAAARARKLREAYPELADASNLGGPLPSAVAAEVRGRARRGYERALAPARALLVAWLKQASPSAPDSPRAWRALRRRLDDPRELADWAVLARALARLAGDGELNPVQTLADFLDQQQFTIALDRATLEIPDDLGFRPAADAALTATHGAGGFLTLAPTDEGARVGEQPVHAYGFRVEKGRTFEYASGDRLSAALSLRDGKSLRWDRCRSVTFRFEALRREPVLLEGDQRPDAGRPREGVRLRLEPDDGVPRVPDLVPDLTGQGR